MTATATIVVDFGAGAAEGHLAAELDSDRNGGKTTFEAGDTVYFKVYADQDYEVAQTAGQTSRIVSNETGDESELVSFVNSATGNVSKYVKRVDDWTWYGSGLGTISKAGSTSVKAASGGDDEIGIATVEYTTEYDVWKLVPPAGMPDDYAILIVVKAS